MFKQALNRYPKSLLCAAIALVLFVAPTILEMAGYPLPNNPGMLSAAGRCYGLGAVIVLLIGPGMTWYEYEQSKNQNSQDTVRWATKDEKDAFEAENRPVVRQ
jgi:hypothetical protein